MSKIKYFIMTLIMAIILLFTLCNISNAATKVTVTRNILSNGLIMKFNFSGLSLDKKHEYEYGLTKTSAMKVENWYLITDYTTSTAVVNISATTKTLREVINTVDTGYITIKDKTTNKIVLEPYAIDLKIPFLSLTNYIVIPNGKTFGNNEKNCINIALRNAHNSSAYFQYEKITDKNIIKQYKEIKNKNGNIAELQNKLKNSAPTSSWIPFDYWNGHASEGTNGFGYTESSISVPDTGLYYMWLYFSGSNLKDMYGYILVDNLEPDIALESVSLVKTSIIELGKTLILTPGFTPEKATNKIVTWTSSDETVATVDNAGRVTPKKIGSTIITVVSQDGNKKASCTVTVTDPSINQDKNDSTKNPDKNNNSNVSTDNKTDNKVNNTQQQKPGTNNNSANSNKTNTPDKTVATTRIPQTGIGIGLACLIIAVICVAVVVYFKYNRLKDI